MKKLKNQKSKNQSIQFEKWKIKKNQKSKNQSIQFEK